MEFIFSTGGFSVLIRLFKWITAIGACAAFYIPAASLTLFYPVYAEELPLVTQAFTAADRNRVARSLKNGNYLKLTGLQLEQFGVPADLELERFEVFAPDAKIIVNDDNGEQRVLRPPESVYYRGSLSSDPGSSAYLVFRQSGGMRGIIGQGNTRWIITDTSVASVATARAADKASSQTTATHSGFACGAGALKPPIDINHAVLAQVTAPVQSECIQMSKLPLFLF